MTEQKQQPGFIEKIALGASVIILGAFAWYWYGQIMNAVEMLSLAYGWGM